MSPSESTAAPESTPSTSAPAPQRPDASPWGALRHSTFRALWLATVTSNIGTWMNDVGANWLMTSLTPNPLMVAMVQAAGSLPMFLFAIPSGVLADILDRRKYLIVAQIWMLIVALTLGVLAVAGWVSPTVLLAATFLLSVGAAMAAPAFQAIVPDLVERPDLPSAISLNSLGINVSRAIGPALGGFILSLYGPGLVFLLNGVSVVGVIIVLYRWNNAKPTRQLPPENFLPAIGVGLRYVQAAPGLRTVLVRAVAFFLFGSAGWALLPIVARRELGLGPGGYGLLLTSIGIGAVVGALALPSIRKKLSDDGVTVTASLVFALSMLALAFVRNFWLLAVLQLFAGLSWIGVLSTLNVAAQRSSAGWVKARALAVYLTVFYGAMTAGSAVWGKTAQTLGTPTSLVIAAFGMALATTAALRWRLSTSAELDLTPSAHLIEHGQHASHDRGPVMVMVEYQIDAADAAEFKAAALELRRVRKRVGALSWGIYEDMDSPGRFVETFVVESWLEHLRQHERYTANDKLIRDRVHRLHRGGSPPALHHFLAPE